jgi:hypothetical protein
MEAPGAHEHGTLVRGRMPDAELVMIKASGHIGESHRELFQVPAFLYGWARREVPVSSRSGPRHAATPKPIPPGTGRGCAYTTPGSGVVRHNERGHQ